MTAIVESFPRRVRTIENVWIPMSDGARIAARIWLPADAEEHPVPAIFEFLPYRKRDFTRSRDEPMHAWFAGHGFAAVRADVRGTGDSDGILTDEYTRQEHDDALEILRWIAAQPWCTGKVGMMGISWGGFNTLQIAARRPPELGAVIALCASEDRYADDAHYMGGCLLNENLTWGSVLLSFNAYPPDPAVVGERWRAMWLERLESSVLFPALWLEHQRRDAYWKHGSIGEDWGAIHCPVWAVGGWADGYSNAVPRLLAGLGAPCRGLVGPWAHVFPHDGVPGPTIGFLQEARAWWEHWLAGGRGGRDVLADPVYRVWMQESVPPRMSCLERPGRWVAETSWPSPRIVARRFALAPGRLVEPPALAPRASEAGLRVRSPQTTGQVGGDWCAFGVEGELPADQRPDDGRSLVFDGPALPERLEILGAPAVELDLASDRPVALIAVRLNDVAPHGSSLRVTYGLLNLTHHGSHESPRPLEPGKRYRVRVALNHIAHAFPVGHRVRLAISTAYWPIAWPPPEPVTLTVWPEASVLELPERPPREEDASLRPFPPPEHGPPLRHTTLHPDRFVRTITRDLRADETVHTIASHGGEFEGASVARIDAIDLDLGYRIVRRYRIGQQDPLSARAEVEQETTFRRGDWRVRVATHTRLSSTRDAFRLQASLEADESDSRTFERHWDETLPRDLV